APGERAPRLRHRAPEADRRRQPAREALAAQALDFDPLDRIARGRNKARLDAALGTEPHDVAICAQLARDGERGKDMPSGPARHDHDGAAHGERPSEGIALLPDATTSWWTRSSIPTQASVTSMLERPY